jgi:peptidoglycan-associated lipoprotein
MIAGRLTRTIIAFCLLALILGGCARPIVRPNQPTVGGPAPTMPQPSSGSVAENELQAVQAQLKIVYFDYDSYTISPQAQTDLQYNAEILRRAAQVRLVAEGHCDERGTSEYNLALGDRRARAVVDYLAGLGLSPQRFSTVSYGSELPVDPGHNEAAWSQNRRVYLGVSN